MSILSRLKRGVKATANAAIDSAISPEKELELAIAELDEMRKKAVQELIDYKASAKLLEQELTKYQQKAEKWDERARAAVTAGDDALARNALAEKRSALLELEKIRRDRDEAAGYALELNRSRKAADTRLRILKLKRGTMAQQLAAARSGGASALSMDTEVWDRFERAEDKIDAEAIAAEVEAALEGEDLSPGVPPGDGGGLAGDDPLAALKAKMAASGATLRPNQVPPNKLPPNQLLPKKTGDEP